jgi:hypothetical protein
LRQYSRFADDQRGGRHTKSAEHQCRKSFVAT